MGSQRTVSTFIRMISQFAIYCLRLEPHILRDRQNSPKTIRDANLTVQLGHTVFPITQQRPRPLHALTALFPEGSNGRDLTEMEHINCILSATRQSGA